MADKKVYTLDRVVRILISIILIGASIYFINYIKAALLPFLLAWLLAYFINPAVEFVQQKMRVRSKMLSIIIVLVTLVMGISAVVLVSIPSITHEIGVVVEAINRYLEGEDLSRSVPQWMQDYLHENLTFKSVMAELRTYNLTEIVNKVISWVWSLVAGSLNMVFGLVASLAVLLYMVFILLDYDRIRTGAVTLIPHKYRHGVALILGDLSISMNRYFRGQALVALIVGILFAIGFTIIGLPLGFALGLFIGLLNMVPYLQLIGIVPMAFLSLVMCIETGDNFWVIFALSLGVMSVVQILQDTLIVPKIMGKVTGLNPAVILLSLSIWGVLLGVIGMIIALPMTTLLLSYYKHFIINGGDINEESIVDVHHDKEQEFVDTL